MEILGFFFYIILAFIMGGIGAGRRVGFWFPFLFSIFLTPIVGLLVAVTSQRLPDTQLQARPLQGLKETPAATGGIASEIEKLRNLLEQGYITQEEFERGKSTILNKQ